MQVHTSIYVYTKNGKQVHTQTYACKVCEEDTYIHTSRTQEDICKKDVVTFGCVGKEIIGMMEIWSQAYAHTLTHMQTHTITFSLGIQGRKT